MKSIVTALLFVLALASPALAQRSGVSPDPYAFGENKRPDQPFNNTTNCGMGGRTEVSKTLNTAVKNLVIIVDGQSNATPISSAFAPVNASNIVNVSICDGNVYNIVEPLTGFPQTLLGISSLWERVADTLITNGTFAKVWLVPIAVGGSAVEFWTPGGVLYDRPCVAMRRLADLGITPSTPNFWIIDTFNQGESNAGTSAPAYTAAYNSRVSRLRACPGVTDQFNFRHFIARETMLAGVTDATVAGAQVALVNGTTIFGLGNMDSIGGRPDGTHLSTPALQSSYVTLAIAAMTASGAPF